MSYIRWNSEQPDGWRSTLYIYWHATHSAERDEQRLAIWHQDDLECCTSIYAYPAVRSAFDLDDWSLLQFKPTERERLEIRDCAEDWLDRVERELTPL